MPSRLRNSWGIVLVDQRWSTQSCLNLLDPQQSSGLYSTCSGSRTVYPHKTGNSPWCSLLCEGTVGSSPCISSQGPGPTGGPHPPHSCCLPHGCCTLPLTLPANLPLLQHFLFLFFSRFFPFSPAVKGPDLDKKAWRLQKGSSPHDVFNPWPLLLQSTPQVPSTTTVPICCLGSKHWLNTSFCIGPWTGRMFGELSS